MLTAAKSPLRRLAASLPLLLEIGCTSSVDSARDGFSQDYSCPRDSVIAVERKEADGYEVAFGKDVDPAADIKSDPSRYAIWKKERQAAHEQWNGANALVEAKGCDHVALYVCATGANQNGSQSRTCTRAMRQDSVGAP